MNNDILFENKKKEYSFGLNLLTTTFIIVLIGLIITFVIVTYLMINKGKKTDLLIKEANTTVDYSWYTKKNKEEFERYIKAEGDEPVVKLFNKAMSEEIFKNIRGKEYWDLDGTEITLDHAGFFCAQQIYNFWGDDKDTICLANFNSYNGKNIDLKDIFTEEGYKEIIKETKETLTSKANLGNFGNNDIVFTLYPSYISFSVKKYENSNGKQWIDLSNFNDFLEVSYDYNNIKKYLREDSPVRFLL